MAITFAFLQIDGICFVRVHSMSMYRSQCLALLPRCCSISVSRPTSSYTIYIIYYIRLMIYSDLKQQYRSRRKAASSHATTL